MPDSLTFLKALVVAVAVSVAACAKPAASTTDSAGDAGGRGGRGGGAGGPVPVSTTQVIEKELPVTVTTVGAGEASATVEVRPQITGQLTSVEFTEGQEVQQGQTLFKIDPRPFDVALKQAEAALAKDAAQADNAKAQLQRSDDLLKQGLVAPADNATLLATVKTLVETMNADQAQIDSARLNLQYTQIVAPITGRTGALLVHQGSLVRTSDTAPLVIVNQLTPIRVTFSVPGQYLARIRSGQANAPLLTQARAAGGDGPQSSGRIAFIDNVIDSTTGTIKLKAVFPNADRLLWPGELVEVTLQLSVDSHAVVVPVPAVQNGQQGQYVFVVASDRSVSMRPVKVARTLGDDAVIASGLKAGEEVVTDGQLRLTPGARISVKPPVGGRGAS